jgi:hypothetical protein
LGDAKRIIMRRIVINLLIGLVILAPAVVAIGWKHSFDAVTWIERLGFWVVSVIYFAESMRLVFAPEYRLSGSVVLSLAIISAIKLAMVIVAICIFAVLLVTWSYVFGALTHLRSPAYQTGGPVLQAVMFCMVTFLWTGFAALGPSWTLTAGETFWSTLAVCAAASIAVALPFLGLWQLRSTVNAWCWLIVNVALTYATATLAGGFALPFTARWMLVCEERHAR